MTDLRGRSAQAQRGIPVATEIPVESRVPDRQIERSLIRMAGMGKAAETKARIERAALTLFVARGVAETTTREIALAAGIAEGTIYRHFPSKEAMAEELFLRVHAGLAARLESAQRGRSNLKEKSRAIVEAYCQAADADWLLFSYHLLSQHQHMIQIRIEQANPVAIVRETVRKAMAAGEIPRRDVDVVTAMTLGVVLQPAIHKVYGRIAGELSDHVAILSEAAWAVLCGEAGGAKPERLRRP